MSYNEAETRYHLIDPRLRAKGYDDPSRIRLETPAPVDIEGPKGPGASPPGKTKLVHAWMEIHREDLQADWDLAVNGSPPMPIDPLR
jgi:hypothetical protein